jgi:hypothetical protein
MAKKPYIYEDLEWLEIIRQKSWFDPTDNPGDILPYSEFQKPYMNEKGKHSYPEWEWSWPPIGPIDYPTFPDPVPNPCNFDEDCVWAGIIGPESMECEECFTWSQAHLWIGCDVAPWWAAYGSWELEPGGTECYLLFSGPVMATVCCPDEASGTFTLIYSGPLSCSGSVDVEVTCGEVTCCEAISLTGAAGVNAGSTWTGTISPACPDAICSVESNSGCVFSCGVNSTGSEVYVYTSGSDCGAFTVTVYDNTSMSCRSNSDSATVLINGGSWSYDQSSSDLGMAGCTGCGCGGGVTNYGTYCIIGWYKYGGFNALGNECEGTTVAQCMGQGSGGCTACGGDWGTNICSWAHGGCGGTTDCQRWSWWRCKYECECSG